MKRFLSFFLVFCLIIPFSGCKSWNREKEDNVTFYYQRSDFSYGTEDSVIASELRNVSGHIGDVSYLLALYLMGPTSEELSSPFPRSTRLISALQEDGALRVELSSIRDSLSDSEFTLACACMTLTCLDLSDASEVTIISGDRILTMTRSSLLLIDDMTTSENTTEDTK